MAECRGAPRKLTGTARWGHAGLAVNLHCAAWSRQAVGLRQVELRQAARQALAGPAPLAGEGAAIIGQLPHLARFPVR